MTRIILTTTVTATVTEEWTLDVPPALAAQVAAGLLDAADAMDRFYIDGDPTITFVKCENTEVTNEQDRQAVSVEVEQVDPNAWAVSEIVHISTGQTISPDEQTGDEWTVVRLNPTAQTARVETTYAVVRYPTDAEGIRIDTSEVPDEDAHEHWQYAIEEVTTLLVGTDPDDLFGTEVWSSTEEGEGSYVTFRTEEAADAACENMAKYDAGLLAVVTWDGTPQD